MSPTTQRDTTKNILMIVGFLVSFGGILLSTGVSLNRIDVNARDISELKKDGCGPANKVDAHYEAIMVRLDAIKADVERIERQSKEMNDKQDAQLVKIIDGLLP